jgi:transcriptional regulator with XRE-family HTH domain
MRANHGRHCFTCPGLPNLLRAHRCFLGLRQADLAGRIGCSVPLISRIERAHTMPRIETAVRLAREVGRTVPEVFPDLISALGVIEGREPLRERTGGREARP